MAPLAEKTVFNKSAAPPLTVHEKRAAALKAARTFLEKYTLTKGEIDKLVHDDEAAPTFDNFMGDAMSYFLASMEARSKKESDLLYARYQSCITAAENFANSDENRFDAVFFKLQISYFLDDVNQFSKSLRECNRLMPENPDVMSFLHSIGKKIIADPDGTINPMLITNNDDGRPMESDLPGMGKIHIPEGAEWCDEQGNTYSRHQLSPPESDAAELAAHLRALSL